MVNRFGYTKEKQISMKIKKIATLMMGLSFSLCIFAQDDWQLVWSDEFDTDGSLNSSVWNFEQGYARNEEAQWYQSDNAVCKNGLSDWYH